MAIIIINLQNKVNIRQNKIRSIVGLVLSSEDRIYGEVTITISTDQRIRTLNRKFLGKDYSTDVLAFSFIEGKSLKVKAANSALSRMRLLGDVVVSAGTAIRNAKKYNTTAEYEIYLYVIHGILHLLGFDDANALKKAIMRKKEQYYLKKYYNL